MSFVVPTQPRLSLDKIQKIDLSVQKKLFVIFLFCFLDRCDANDMAFWSSGVVVNVSSSYLVLSNF